MYTTYTYDVAGNLTDLINYDPDSSILSRFDYTYDVSGLRTSMSTLDGTFTYGYDALGQLTSVTYPDGHIVTYDYDAAGNRRQVIDNGVATSYTTNNLNQYTQVGDTTYAYDADGNMTSQTENGVTTTYSYDPQNRLVGVSTPTDTWTYAYDALGNRVASSENGVVTKYIIDPIGLGNLAAEYNGNGNVVARYDYGYGLIDRKDAAGNPAYYTFSAIGNTSELTDSNGVVSNRYDYDPFGLSLGKIEKVANPFQFVGEYGVIAESDGLDFMRARHYDPTTADFSSVDPLGTTAIHSNTYGYTPNNAVNTVDPLGLWSATVSFGPYRGTVGGDLSTGDFFIGGGIGVGVPLPSFFVWANHNDFGFSAGIPDVGGLAFSTLPPAAGVNFPGTLAGGLGAFGSKRPGDPLAVRPGIGFSFNIGVNLILRVPPNLQPLLQPLNWPYFAALRFLSRFIRAWDPNDKLAPTGFGDAAYIQANSSLSYEVRFENESTATAPARLITVTDTLDPNLDLSTFELTEIDFANSDDRHSIRT